MSQNVYRRYDVVAATKNRVNGDMPKKRTADINSIFGVQTLTMDILRERLSKEVYKSLDATIQEGKQLDASVADAVAIAMKNWAIEQGATHFTHWFQPLTGSTAEKHDSFVTPNAGGGAMYRFSGKDLIQGEPDASSFPSGGLRATFEARGYTAWDPTSPAFLIINPHGATLCIPTAFASWTGEALDHKTPLLRSMESLNKQAQRALAFFNVPTPGRVSSTVGAEQEYFLIDEEFYYRRPDLVASGRTLFGAQPARGQELDDHYFGSIPERVLAYMTEVEYTLYRLGVPVKTRHNEVAPGQYEIAPIFEQANLAADHQQIVMQTLLNKARHFGLVCLLQEKPFAGLNGSGKHLNWSMATDSGMNLLEPGDSPHTNLQFLFFCAAVIKAVDRHQDLLRICVASAGNDHRLGANEAPPAIISIFLGEELEAIFDQISAGRETSSDSKSALGLGSAALPRLPRHSGDRNRTSPFAFTGNKFEFRALGSNQSISFPVVVVNTIVAEAIDEMTTELETHVSAGRSHDEAVTTVLHDTIAKHRKIVFNGDNYTQEWREEAERRGLLHLKTALDAYQRFDDDKNVRLFEKYEVLSKRELKAREEVYLDQYVKTLAIEGASTASIAQRMILPGAIRYLNDVVQTYRETQNSGLDAAGVRSTMERVNRLINAFQPALERLATANDVEEGDDIRAHAHHELQQVIPAMNAVRAIADELESVVPDDYWPLPTYEEMLFVK